ncbi:hypothetical protein [Salinigranum marinum]|uniref:hypothetical protein n=1 Tax=Salinigranum marinum TaxID=1515595 RepID=UPI002989EB63|nr:hypothetical protein [Salinigranum marinum]
MPTDHNVCGQRIAYNRATHGALSERETEVYESANKEVEDILALLAEIQNARTSAEGEITRPLTRREIGTIFEVSSQLHGSSTILEAFEEGL